LEDKQEHKQSYYQTFYMLDESLANFEVGIYTADEEVANTNWMFDRNGIFVFFMSSTGQ